MPPNKSDRDLGRTRINRRRLLQVAGVGVSSLALTTVGRSTAQTANTCAEGPFKRTYTGTTVNISKIGTQGKKGDGNGTVDDPPPTGSDVMGASKATEEHHAQPADAQRAPDTTGLLTIGAEYDGIRDTTVLPAGLLAPNKAAPPSDSQIAVGWSKTVQAINNEIAIFNQRSGQLELEVPFEAFFAPLITEETFVGDIPNVADPRLRYDPNANRFVLSTFYVHFPSWTGAWFLAVSDGSNPNGKWHLYRIPTISGDWPDYPPMGLDQDAIYLTGFTIPQSGSFPADYDEELAILDKQAAYNGEELAGNHFTGLLTGGPAKFIDFVIQPAYQPFSGGQSGSYYLMNFTAPNPFVGDQLTLWEVTDPLGEPSVECSTVDVGRYRFPPSARQRGTDALVATTDQRLMNLDYNDGSLWTAHAIGYDWDDGVDEHVAAIRWYEIDPVTESKVQSGVYGEPGTSYYYPHIESDGDRTLIVHVVSGPETYPSIGVTGRTADYTTGEIEDSLVVQEGQSPMGHPDGFSRRDPVWWQDYTGASIHPSTGDVWVTAQYSPVFDVSSDSDQPDRYQTRIAEVSFDGNGGGR